MKFEGETPDTERKMKEEAARPPLPAQSEGGTESTADENIGGVQRPPADS